MYSLPFSYSDSPLFKPNFCFVFHFEKVDQKIASVYHHQEIINIKSMIDLRKKKTTNDCGCNNLFILILRCY